MTKDDIKKALEICNDIYAPCNGCPYEKCTNCDNTLHTDALNVIIEQEKEIEYRKKQYDNQIAENTRLYIEYDKAFERLKAQQREIERLKDKCEELRNEKWNAQDDLDCYCDEMPNKIKRAKIDILNEVKKRLDSAPNGWAYTTYIDELIEEVEK